MTTILRSCTDVKTTKFTYKWEIKNFRDQLDNVNGSLASEPFYQSTEKESKWQLTLDFEYKEDPDYTSLYLNLIACKGKDVRCKYRFFISPNKSYVHDEVQRIFTPGLGWGFRTFMKTSEILNDEEGHLIEDTLTIGCDLEIQEDIPLNHNDSEIDTIKTTLEATVEKYKFLNDLDSLLNNDFDDSYLRIICNLQKFYAHKKIQSDHSSVFSARLADEGIMNDMTINDVTGDILKDVLHYIYSDRIRNKALALELLSASEKYQLNGLKYMCEIIFIDNLHYDNAVQTLLWADLYNAEELKKGSLEFICKNEKHVCTTDSFQSLLESNSPWLAEIYRTLVLNHMNT
uniref:BTB domain-containing protein n=1 Tax=Bracon brevicornis TaxID=1563983 RepID=A0A6V7I4A1_9HYME